MKLDNRQKDLSAYRLQEANDSLKVAENCLKGNFYKDSINRSYYAAFYAVKSVLALNTVDFKRHKDVMAYFNKEYVASGMFPREIGRLLGMMQRVREKSDYDDFYIASKEKAEEQFKSASIVIDAVIKYLEKMS